jgi:hypothetical protein
MIDARARPHILSAQPTNQQTNKPARERIDRVARFLLSKQIRSQKSEHFVSPFFHQSFCQARWQRQRIIFDACSPHARV